jgi:ABC-type phosphate/phosphonate transport system ATPase subunit
MSPSDLGGCGGDSAPLCRAVVEPPVVVEVAGLSKAYGGVTALERMDLRVRRGRVHAVVGENGAGKSTLMKILAGAVSADSGSIRLDGRQVELGSPRAAQAHGMGIVYQELSLCWRPSGSTWIPTRRWGASPSGSASSSRSHGCCSRIHAW